MDSKAVVGLSIAAGAVVAGGVYNLLHSASTSKMSVGGGLIAGGVNLLYSYAKNSVARWAISAGVGVAATLLLIPTISWLISSFGGAASQPEPQRPVLEPKKIDLEGKEWVDGVCSYMKGAGLPSKIDFYGKGVKCEWLVTGKNGQDQKLYEEVFDKDGARLLNSSGDPLFLDVKKHKEESRLSRKM